MAKIGLVGILGMAAAAVSGTGKASAPVPAPEKDVAAPTQDGTRTAVFAGGCFWCTEAAFEQLEGVSNVESGYAGDTKDNASYRVVGSGMTKHAEAIRITYDPKKISYGQLLQVLFAISEPTVKDKQGPDAGPQYRMAVFFANDEEKVVTQAYIAQLEKAKIYDRPIVTTVEPIGAGFFLAEDYHQDYVKHNPNQPYVQAWSIPKAEKVKELFPDKVKK